MSPDQPKLSGRHQDTLEQIFAHPLSHNVEWHAVVSLLGEVSTVKKRRDGGVEVVADREAFVLARPRHKDLGADELMRVRHLLERLGLGVATD